ncbi:MAG: isopentenyl phosphate kinase [Candidatus Promineifilaceae bacterium]
MNSITFLKLGGSLITDKADVEAVRYDVLLRIANEVARTKKQQPKMSLIIGHGGGSFGHVAAARYNTRKGVATPEEWLGFAEVHAAMSRLNQIVVETLLGVGVPVVTFPPVALGYARNGRVSSMYVDNIRHTLATGLVPVLHGDVAYDGELGGTIVSTEEVMAGLMAQLPVKTVLLAGEVEGVLDNNGQLVPAITPQNFSQIAPVLGGSRGTDVTGGMASKVAEMVALAEKYPSLTVKILSGLVDGRIQKALIGEQTITCTTITAE